MRQVLDATKRSLNDFYYKAVCHSKERMDLVANELATSVSTKQAAESVLSQIREHEVKCRMLYQSDIPLGAVVYDRHMKKNNADSSTKNSLLIHQILILQEGKKNLKEVFEKLVDKATSCYREAGLDRIYLSTLPSTPLFDIASACHFQKMNEPGSEKEKTEEELLLYKELSGKEELDSDDGIPVVETSRKRKLEDSHPSLHEDMSKKRKLDGVEIKQLTSTASTERNSPHVRRDACPTIETSSQVQSSQSSSPSYRSHEVTLRRVNIKPIQSGEKTIEARIRSGMFLRMHQGDRIRFFYPQNQRDDVVCRIKKINAYGSFPQMLEAEGFKLICPDCNSLQQAIDLCHSIPDYKQRAERNGVIAIHLEKLK